MGLSSQRIRQVLLDSPTATPVLGYREIGHALLINLQAQVENVRSELQVLRNDSILKPLL
jgi:hypothetical protein